MRSCENIAPFAIAAFLAGEVVLTLRTQLTQREFVTASGTALDHEQIAQVPDSRTTDGDAFYFGVLRGATLYGRSNTSLENSCNRAEEFGIQRE